MSLANASRPMGFIPYNMGGRANPIITPRPAAASRTGNGVTNDDLAIGDAYTIDASGNVHRAAATDPVHGIVVGFRLAPDASVMGGQGPISYDYLKAANAGTILGCEDPSALFVIQADTYAETNKGQRVNHTDAAPDSTFRQSRQTLNVGGGSVAPFNFGIDGLDFSPADNAVGTNARVRVRLLNTFNN